MAATLRIASRVLPRLSGSLCITHVAPRALNSRLGSRNISNTAARFEIIKKYTEDHEWISVDTTTNIGTIGITEYAQKALGDVVYVELPVVGEDVSAGDSIGSVESVKSASDIMSPVSGTIKEANLKLDEKPSHINQDAEGETGWFARIEVNEAGLEELNSLMDAEAYKSHTSE